MRRRYIVRSSLIGWAHTQNDPCELCLTYISSHKSAAADVSIQLWGREQQTEQITTATEARRIVSTVEI